MAVNKTSDMGSGFRQVRRKADGGVISTKSLQEQGEMSGKRGHPYLQNHLVVKNNQCLVLPVSAPGRGKELLADHHLCLAKQELCPPHCSSRPLWEAPAALEMGHSGGTTRSKRSPWDAGMEKPMRTPWVLQVRQNVPALPGTQAQQRWPPDRPQPLLSTLPSRHLGF